MKRNNTAAHYYQYAMFWSIVLLVLCGLICLLLLLPAPAKAESIGLSVLIMLFSGGYFTYILIQYLTYTHVKFSHIQNVKLDKVETIWRDMHGFTIVVKIDGDSISVSTKHVFGSALFAPNHLDQYSGRTVEVGYFEKRDEWVVLTEID